MEFDNLEALVTAPPPRPFSPSPNSPPLCDNRKRPQFISMSNCDCDKSSWQAAATVTEADCDFYSETWENASKCLFLPSSQETSAVKKAHEESGESSEERWQFELVSETQPLRQHAAVIR